MKTNVVLSSTDRELFGVTIRQNTKEKYLSLTDLQRAYEKARWVHGWNDKRINDILSSKDTRERIFYLLLERGLIKTEFSVFIEMVEKEGLTKVLKGLELYKTTGRGSDKTVMCDPYVWILIAMELNPMLYAKVIIWLTDSLIFDRIEAGTEYRPMNSCIKKIVGESTDYSKYAKLINTNVFGQHQTGMRNLASAKELKKIADIEKFVINAIEQGWLKNDTDITNAINNYK
jgi:hypothetical protein